MGGAVGEALGKRGAEVVRADRQAELAETVAGGIRSKGGRATAAELDVTDFRAVERLVQQTAERHGRLDYMFNNAGIGIGGGLRYLYILGCERCVAVNIHGRVNGCQGTFHVAVG